MGFRLELAPYQSFVLREGVSIRNTEGRRIVIIIESVDPDEGDEE